MKKIDFFDILPPHFNSWNDLREKYIDKIEKEESIELKSKSIDDSEHTYYINCVTIQKNSLRELREDVEIILEIVKEINEQLERSQI